MTTGDMLMAEIRANPKDDDPRLVYSDWLEEHGSGEYDKFHSELIRLMIAVHRDQPEFELDWRMNSKVYDGSSCQEIRRIAFLVREMWLKRHRTLQKWNSWQEYIWRRGFAEKWVGGSYAWKNEIPELVLTHPVQQVQFKDVQFAYTKAWIEKPGIHRGYIVGLNINGGPYEDKIVTPSLHLNGYRYWESIINILCRAYPTLPREIWRLPA